MSTGNRRIYHLTTPTAWAQGAGQPYRPQSLTTEGFVHCSYREQVERVANTLFAGEPLLMLLGIDVNRLIAPVRDEDVGIGELFPHVYGPIQAEAVLTIDRLTRNAQGQWVVPDSLKDY